MSKPLQTRIVELTDERDPSTASALGLIEETFDRRDRQPVEELSSEIAEKRLQLTSSKEFHLLAALDAAGRVGGTISGIYLDGVNAGFVAYLAVRPESRRSGIGRRLRTALVERFRADAARSGFDDLAWVLGEVRLSSPWLRRLVRWRGAVPFDITYYHPGVTPPDVPKHALYRQPVADDREVVSADLVRRLIYAIYHRAFRVRYPLMHTGFQQMVRELEDRSEVGMHPQFAGLAEAWEDEKKRGAGPRGPTPRS